MRNGALGLASTSRRSGSRSNSKGNRHIALIAASRTCVLRQGARSASQPGALKSVSSPNSQPVSRSEEHTSELQSLMRISYAVFCLQKKNKNKKQRTIEMTSRQQK